MSASGKQGITEQELEQRLLAACNCLRGPVDPTDYKAYIFPLLFLKRISDYWNWEYARALDGFGRSKSSSSPNALGGRSDSSSSSGPFCIAERAAASS